MGYNGLRQGKVKFEMGGRELLEMVIFWPLEEEQKKTTKKVQYTEVDNNGYFTLETNKLSEFLALI